MGFAGTGKGKAAKAAAKPTAAPRLAELSAGEKRPAAVDLEVPAKFVKAPSDGVGEMKKPVLPSSASAELGAKEVMKSVVPWALAELLAPMRKSGKWGPSVDLAALEPLRISSVGSGSASSFKQHWVP